MFKVIRYFEDLQDNRHPYKVGETYPRKGLKPDAARILELSTDANRRGVALIEEVQPEKTVEDVPKKRGRKSAAK